MSRAVVLACSMAAVTMLLHGCGGGGGGGSPTPAPSPTPPPGPAPGTPYPINILSFNLKWYALHGMEDIQSTITANGPYDIMGLQECENVDQVVTGLNGSWGTMQLWDGPHDIGIAWDKTKFKNITSGVAETGRDSWWTRQMQWVRLQIIGTSDYIFFANVHGAVGQCNATGGEDVLSKYTTAINANMKDGDHFFFTGDFNCQTYDDVMQGLGKIYNDSAQASWFFPILYQPDHIFTSKTTKTVNSTGVCCARPGWHCDMDNGDRHCIAYPSDHELLKGEYILTLGGAGAASKIVV